MLVRVKDLQVGDRFKMFSTEYRINKIEDQNFACLYVHKKTKKTGMKLCLGRNSEQLVERVLEP